ncbi:MAG: tetratricopeptide repeat protein [Flavobacteriales bacterium]|nr:tetratricopeptide repeat protein [Flavobacteriales bacterium]
MPRSCRLLLPLVLPLVLACGGAKPVAEKPRDHEGAEATHGGAGKNQRALIMRLFMEANQARLKGELPKAIQLFEATLKEDPQNAASMFELAKLYNQAQAPQEALALAKRAVATDKDNIWYRFLLADMSLQNSDLAGAAKAYQDIIAKWPDRYEVYFGLAGTLAEQKKITEARQVYRDLEKRIGSNQELVMREYDMLANAGQTEAARDLLTDAIAKHPEETQYYGMLAEVHETLGDTAKAEELYKKALALDPDDSMTRISLAQFYYNSGRAEEGFTHLREAFGDPDLDIDPKMQLLLGFYEMSGHPSGDAPADLVQQSHALIEELKKAHPQSGKPWSIEGDFYTREGNTPAARDAFAKAVEFDQDRFPIWSALLQLDAQINDYAALQQHAQRATELFPTQPEFYLYKGIAASQLKKHDEAIEALVTGRDLVVDNRPLEGQFWSSLGDAYNAAKEFPKSDAAYDKALAINPDDATVLNNYAYYLSERDEQLEKAERMSRKCNDLQPGVATYLDTYAWIFYKQGKYPEARTWQEKAIASGGDKEAVLIEHYGDILFKLGDSAGAVEQWKKAKDLGGASELIGRKITEGKLVE